MKLFRKTVAAALAVLTMLTASIPASAAAARYTITVQNKCSPCKLTEQLSKNGSCKRQYRIICKGGQCAQQTDPAGQSSSTPAASSTETPAVPVQSSDTATLSAYEQEVITLTNQYRVQYGLAPLSADTHLSEIARLKSQDMHDKGYFDHNSPTYGTPFEMMKQFGVNYRYAGENIAMGYRTAKSVVEGWMSSPGHRANILNANFTKIGVGYVADGNYYTQMFIGV